MKVQEIEDNILASDLDHQLAHEFAETPIEIRSYILKFAYRPPQVFWVLIAGKRRGYHDESLAKSLIDACQMLCTVLYKSHKIIFEDNGKVCQDEEDELANGTEILVSNDKQILTTAEGTFLVNGDSKYKIWHTEKSIKLYHIIQDTENNSMYLYKYWQSWSEAQWDEVHIFASYIIYKTRYYSSKCECQVPTQDITRTKLREFESELCVGLTTSHCDITLPDDLVNFILYDKQPIKTAQVFVKGLDCNLREKCYNWTISRVEWEDELI